MRSWVGAAKVALTTPVFNDLPLCAADAAAAVAVAAIGVGKSDCEVMSSCGEYEFQ